MLVATFGPTTAWQGREIIWDADHFILVGHGTIPAAGLLDYDRRGQLIWADVGCFHGHGQAIRADLMRDHRLERPGPAWLRMDAYPIGHRIRPLVDQDPGRVARKAMAGVMSGRLTER